MNVLSLLLVAAKFKGARQAKAPLFVLHVCGEPSSLTITHLICAPQPAH